MPASVPTPIENISHDEFDIILDDDQDDILSDLNDILDSNKPRLGRASSAPDVESRNNSISIQRRVVLPAPSSALPVMSYNPSFETVPHHYQYMGGSTMPPPAHLIPSTPDTRIREDKKARKRAATLKQSDDNPRRHLQHRHTMPPGRLIPHQIDTQLSMFQLSSRAANPIVHQSSDIDLFDMPSNESNYSDNPHASDGIIYYSILVRAQVQTQNQGLLKQKSTSAPMAPLRQPSLSIFGKVPRGSDDDMRSHMMEYTNTRKSRLFRQKIASALDLGLGEPTPPSEGLRLAKSARLGLHIVNPSDINQLMDADGDMSPDLEPVPMNAEPVPINDLPNTNSLSVRSNQEDKIYLDTPRALDDNTALEIRYGARLPKIRPNKMNSRTTDNVRSILANAVVKEEPTAHKNSFTFRMGQNARKSMEESAGVSTLSVDKGVLFSPQRAHVKSASEKVKVEHLHADIALRENMTQARYYTSKSNIAHTSRTDLIELDTPSPVLDTIVSKETFDQKEEETIFDDEGRYARINTTATNMQSAARQKRLLEYAAAADSNKDEHHRNDSDQTLLSNRSAMSLKDGALFGVHDPEILKSQEAFNADDVLIEKPPTHIACKFTVVGSPLLTENDEAQANNKKSIKTTQRTWMFSDPSDLILGLQGVHHSEDSPVWMDLVCDAETFVMISEHVRPTIHSLTIEDCVTIDCREKLELFDEYLFCCIRTTSVHQGHNTEKLCIIVCASMIITYHTEEACENVLSEARTRLEKRHKVKCPSPGWVCHTVIDVIVDRMIPEVECRVQEVQNVENLVFALSGTSQEELLQRLQIARNWLMVYRSRLWPKSTITHNFVNADWRVFLAGVQQQYWNDINDHVARMVDLLSLGQSTLESAQNIFVAKISLEMADQSNQLSDSAGRLTAVGSIFLPLSFFAGLWGMNCKVPFQYEGPDTDGYFTDDYYGFIIVFCFMIMSAVGTYLFAMKYAVKPT
eukprot:584657_1